jgi:hypothetical protein
MLEHKIARTYLLRLSSILPPGTRQTVNDHRRYISTACYVAVPYISVVNYWNYLIL